MAEEVYSLRYAVLRHEGIPEPHYDLLFETTAGSVLAAWRAPGWPVGEDGVVTPLPDHRRVYLEYEGPVSGNRGTVRRVAEGHHRVQKSTPGMLVVQLENGRVLRLRRASFTTESTEK
ncbi:MAG TPA: hypothetical protein VHP11_13030 [Tepidisphaeraceae bacterium]|nr:hypothetical protein [Tepidisphaeraceae bacterium]